MCPLPTDQQNVFDLSGNFRRPLLFRHVWEVARLFTELASRSAIDQGIVVLHDALFGFCKY